MNNQLQVETRGSIDRGFLDAVEIEIARALQETIDLEAGLAEMTSGDSARRDSFVTFTENLATWHERLGNLTRHTATVEAELNDQERAMRSWFESLGLTTTRLVQASAAK